MEFEEMKDMVVEVMKKLEGNQIQCPTEKDKLIVNLMNMIYIAERKGYNLEDDLLNKIEALNRSLK